MKLIVGLGNPGEKYVNTRHNAGFMAVNQLLKDLGTNTDDWSSNSKLKSDIASFTLKSESGEEKIILAKPQTFMNESGQAVSLLMSYYKVESDDLWLVYDELDLPMGTLKIRHGGAAAGHRGVGSVMDSIGTDQFWRFRMGIGVSHSKEEPIGKQFIRDAADFVLDNFSQAEQGKLREMIKHTAQAVQTGVEKGLETAMNRFNTK